MNNRKVEDFEDFFPNPLVFLGNGCTFAIPKFIDIITKQQGWKKWKKVLKVLGSLKMIRTFALPITQDTVSEERRGEKRKKRKFFEDIGDSEACSKYPLIYEEWIEKANTS